MVAQFLRLRLSLLANTLRRSPLQVLGMALALLYGVVAAVVLAVFLVGLRAETAEIARAIMIVLGTVVTLAYLLLPLAFKADDALDARRFSLYGVPASRLSVGLAIASLASVPTVVVTVLALAQVVTWSRDGVLVLWAIVAAVLIVATAVLGARVSSAVASLYLASRRARDAAGITLVVVLAILAPLVTLLATIDWESRGLPIVRRIASVVTWTPFGAAWSVPADFADNRAGSALVKLGISVVFLVALWVAWRALVSTMLEHPEERRGRRSYTGLGWFEQLPATPVGVIAARSLSYWSRDSRYRTALGVIPIVPIVMVIVLLIAGVPGSVVAWIPVPVMCLFLGWTVHNDVAHDSTAFWVHVSANTRGVDDRWGRVIPALMLGALIVVFGSIATCVVLGDWSILPGLIGLSACVLLVGLGISSVISASFPYPAVLPGDSAFAQPQAAGSSGSVVQSLSFAGTIVAGVPGILLAVLASSTGMPIFNWVGLVVGLVLGAIVLFAGVRIGGRLIDHRAPELLAFTLQN